MTEIDVAIVGAGAAGLTAAFDLEGSFSYKILEASSVFGGRLRKLENFATYPIDLGAEFIHVGTSILNDLSKQDVTSSAISTVNFLPTYAAWDGSQFVSSSYSPTTDHKFVAYTWYDFFATYIATSAVQSNIEYGCQVTSIDYSCTPVSVVCSNGNEYLASHVIVTVPMKVLQNNVITFTPALPDETTTAINNVVWMDSLKVFLKFNTDFYSSTAQAFNIDDTTGQVGEELYWDSTFGQTTTDHVLTYFAVGQPASSLVGLSDTEIINTILSRLNTVAGGTTATDAYSGTGSVLNWSTESYILGSYSNSVPDVSTLRNSICDKVWFAGEAVPIDDQNGFAHGAALSGRSAAEKVVTLLNGGCSAAAARIRTFFRGGGAQHGGLQVLKYFGWGAG